MREIDILMFLVWAIEYLHRDAIKHDNNTLEIQVWRMGRGVIKMNKQTNQGFEEPKHMERMESHTTWVA